MRATVLLFFLSLWMPQHLSLHSRCGEDLRGPGPSQERRSLSDEPAGPPHTAGIQTEGGSFAESDIQ